MSDKEYEEYKTWRAQREAVDRFEKYRAALNEVLKRDIEHQRELQEYRLKQKNTYPCTRCGRGWGNYSKSKIETCRDKCTELKAWDQGIR